MENQARWIVMLTVLFAVVISTLLPAADAKRKPRRTRADNAKPKEAATLTKSHFVPNPASSIAQDSGSSTPVVSQAVAFAVTEPVSEMDQKTALSNTMRRGKVEANEEKPEKNTSPPLSGHEDFDATVSTQAPSTSPAIPSPASNFEALSNNDNATHPAILGFVNPPDTVGDVGPTQYVQAVNLLFRVYDKSGVPQTAPQPISALFAALGPPCSNNDDGDPIVLYDSFADRWIITQFMVSGATPLSQCVAVSQTGNAAGAYYTYRFVMPNAKFNDYPKFGVWPDGYYWSNNQFNLAGTVFLGVGVFALDRAKLLAGDPTASYIYFDLETTVPNARSMLPADADGLTPPPAGAPNVFSYFNANEFVGETDSLRLYNFHADFANPLSSTFTQRPESPVAVAAFNPLNPAGLDDIEQPPPSGTTSALDAIQDRLMNRLQYRNFGGYESLITNHTVNVGTGTTLATHQAGVRYYELRRTLPAGVWTVNEQATQAPDTHNRWLGSAAMDHEGNLAVGYSVSSTTVFPSIRYAGRFSSDPPGGLVQGEASIQVGAGVQTNTGSRWGDYSSMNVDPSDDCTFWYTQEYYATTDLTPGNAPFGVNWQTRVASFKVNPTCVAPQQGTLQVNVTNCQTGFPVPGASVTINGNLYGATGAGGSNSSQLSPGSYTVNISAPNYFSSGPLPATITNGNTTTINVCITGMPNIDPAGSTITAESCAPADNAISPGETVTLDFGMKNSGTAATSNLVATLQGTGGVTSPSGPQNYGSIPPDNTTVVSRSFTFVADPSASCGDTLTATFDLQDGTSNLGTVTYTFTLGALAVGATSAAYSSGNIAVPIPDVSTVDVPLNVPDAGSITDVNVKVRLNHTFDGDLELRLVAPDGTIVLLSDNRGGATDNYGTGTNDCAGVPTVFDDAATTAIGAGVAPFAGTFKPETPLSALNGKNSAGTWKLRVTDTAGSDVGIVGCFQLEISRRRFVCCGVAGTPDVVAAPPAVITSESCTAPNGAVDPEETITADFPLRNNGDASTNNLVATLLPGGGITPQSGPQSYGVLSPIGPSPTSRPFTFVAQGACGSVVTATLHLQDGPNDLGNVTFTFRLGVIVTATHSFSNNASITIADTPRVGTVAQSVPYPSTINVTGVTGNVSRVAVRLKGFNHTWPDDVDMLLVGPAGQRMIILSDAVGITPGVTNRTYLLDDTAAAIMPATGLPASGTFRPANYGAGDIFTAPAPIPPYQTPAAAGTATFGSVFGGLNPNGNWSLYIVDDVSGDAGSITGGWDLIITTEDPACCDSACTLTCPDDITVNNDPGQCGAVVNYDPVEVDGSCGVISYSHPSGSFFPVGTTTVTVTSTRSDSTTQSCTFDVTVNDTEGPPTGPVTASPNSLWPPNHKMRDITLTYSPGSDNCGGAVNCVVTSVTSNEPVNGTGDGDTAPDWQIISPTQVKLRAERSGGGTGRIYTITVRCTDQFGNHTFRTTTVTVPHNQ